MKILVGNNAMANPGGSETYTYAIIKELVNRGHEVACVTKRRGMAANEAEKLGIRCYFEHIHGKYDLALLSHSTSIALSRNVKAFKIQTCHGIYPDLEQPVGGMDAHVAISEEVQSHLRLKRIDSTLIRNGIDCERFKPVKPINKKLKTILSLSHSGEVNRLLETICGKIGANLIIQNKYKTPVWNVENLINESDLVVSLGRGAYESMACGRNVLIFDKRGYTHEPAMGDGLLTKENITLFVQNNCSGRYSKQQFSLVDLIVQILTKYNSQNGKELREIALSDFNIKKQVDKYLSLVK